MPLLLEHIDAIARLKQRGALYVEFHPLALNPEAGENLSAQDVWAWKTMPDSAWQTLPIRQQLMDWLDGQDIGWKPCGHFAAIGMILGYRGQLYRLAVRAAPACLSGPAGVSRKSGWQHALSQSFLDLLSSR